MKVSLSSAVYTALFLGSNAFEISGLGFPGQQENVINANVAPAPAPAAAPAPAPAAAPAPAPAAAAAAPAPAPAPAQVIKPKTGLQRLFGIFKRKKGNAVQAKNAPVVAKTRVIAAGLDRNKFKACVVTNCKSNFFRVRCIARCANAKVPTRIQVFRTRRCFRRCKRTAVRGKKVVECVLECIDRIINKTKAAVVTVSAAAAPAAAVAAPTKVAAAAPAKPAAVISTQPLRPILMAAQKKPVVLMGVAKKATITTILTPMISSGGATTTPTLASSKSAAASDMPTLLKLYPAVFVGIITILTQLV
ncbi:hypothetical protein AYI70_g11512 [Smittium culicis]|uniref:Uncharacterized protein n=1 Tax=Smittium culicis TaxID=133412 RepID=A0A1R1X1L0_9FUNG|nr:hypothetical protein AYI70_g11512 [Smittium culicis]